MGPLGFFKGVGFSKAGLGFRGYRVLKVSKGQVVHGGLGFGAWGLQVLKLWSLRLWRFRVWDCRAD